MKRFSNLFYIGLIYPLQIQAFSCEGSIKDIFGNTTNVELSCTEPGDQGICGVIDYPVCKATQKWSETLHIVERDIAHIMETYGKDIKSNPDCEQKVRQMRCLTGFSPCVSFVDNGMLTCDASCDDIRYSCPNVHENGILEICATSVYFEQPSSAVHHTFRAPESTCVDLDYTGPSYHMWVIGITLALMFSLVGAIAINLQKLSLNKHGPQVPVYKQPMWILGFFLLLMGTIVDFISYGFAPQSLLAPVAAVTLVWNMLVAPCFLKESLDRFHIIATLIIFVGSVITVVFSNHSSPAYTLADLMDLYRKPHMVVYSIVVPILASIHVSLVYMVDKYKLSSPREEWKRDPPHCLRSCNIVPRPSQFKMLHSIGYAGGAGIIGGQSVLFAKSTMEILKSAMAGNTYVFYHLETYMLISGMFMCLLLQISLLNGGLANHDALVVVPIYQAYWIVSGVLGGLIYFNEIKEMTNIQVILFSFGILLSISGVILLAMRNIFAKQDRVEDEFDETHHDFGSYAVDAWLNMTPRRGAADVLVDMGVESAKVDLLLGTGTGSSASSKQQARARLIEMGISKNIAKRMLGESQKSTDELTADMIRNEQSIEESNRSSETNGTSLVLT